MLRQRLRLVSIAAVITAVTMTMVGVPAAADDVRPAAVPIAAPPAIPSPPELDPGFYRPAPASFVRKEPGEIIAARRITPAALSLIPINVDAWQVSFRSSDTRGAPIVGVTTLLKPRGGTAGPRHLVSQQMAEDSTAAYCSPSYAVQQFSASPALGQAVVPAEFLITLGLLQQGYAVSLPDYQGIDSAYAAGPLHGRIVLDALRAARDFGPLGLDEHSRMGLFGYSGGAIATGHTAEMKSDYAPELPIVGAAAGGVPADLGAVLDAANGHATSGLILAAVLGLAREYPDLDRFLQRRLNPLGQVLRAAKEPLCVQHTSQVLPFINIKGLIDWPGDPLTAPPIRRVLDQTKLGTTRPDMPLYLWHANWDEIVPQPQATAMVNSYCTMPGPGITYTRDHLSEHIIAEIVGAPPAMLWLAERLSGKPATPGCTTHDVGTLTADPHWWPTFSSVIGGDLAALFGVAIGVDG